MNRYFALALFLAVVVGGCARSEVSVEEVAQLKQQAVELANSFTARPMPDEPGIVIQLAFGAEADLDLYVTDPLLETVYFARHESRMGGVIGDDIRCDSPGPRIEEVRFPTLWPGRYRVGIDYPRRCDGQASPVPAAYAVSVQANGKTYTANGLVELEYFEVAVLEFDIEEGEQ